MKKQVFKQLVSIVDFDQADYEYAPEVLRFNAEVEHFENYFRLKLTFPNGSFKELWISQNARVPKVTNYRYEEYLKDKEGRKKAE